LAKNIENSVGFSETICPYSRTLSFGKDSHLAEEGEKEEDSRSIHFSTALRRVQLIEPSKDKFDDFRSLLPPHLAVKLHPSLERLMRTSSEIDGILAVKARFGFMECLENVRS
jgi:hypothetical protein